METPKQCATSVKMDLKYLDLCNFTLMNLSLFHIWFSDVLGGRERDH